MYSIVEGLRMFKEHPLVGRGLGGFRQQMAELGVFGGHGLPLVIHSTPVWLLAETGLIGLLLFAVPAIWLLYCELRRREVDLGGRLVVLSFSSSPSCRCPPTCCFSARSG